MKHAIFCLMTIVMFIRGAHNIDFAKSGDILDILYCGLEDARAEVI